MRSNWSCPVLHYQEFLVLVEFCLIHRPSLSSSVNSQASLLFVRKRPHSPLRKQFFCFHLSPHMSRKILHWLMLGRLLFLLQCSVFLSKACFLSEGAASLVLRKQGVLTFVCFHVCPEKSRLKGSINNHIGRTSYDFPSPLCIFKCFLEVC